MRIVLWDIDGTLVTTAGAGRRAIDRAFADLYGWTLATAGMKLDGRTDPWIVDEVLRARGLSPAQCARERSRVLAVYVERVEDELRRPPPLERAFGPLPGIVSALDRLERRGDCALGLLTGNVAGGARAKLGAFGLWERFAFGAFGDDAADRPGLLPVALERAAARHGRSFGPEDAVVIGDTPRDVEVGKVHGARTVAVATGGGYGLRDLAECGPDVLLETFEDEAALEAVLGRRPCGPPAAVAPLPSSHPASRGAGVLSHRSSSSDAARSPQGTAQGRKS